MNLSKVRGAKTLVLDASLAGPLGLVTDVSLLKHHGVDKMFWLEPGALATNSPNVVYLCRPKIRSNQATCIGIAEIHVYSTPGSSTFKSGHTDTGRGRSIRGRYNLVI